MRRIETMVALMMAVMVLLLMSGCAEEPTGAQIPITPTNQDTPMDVLIPDTDTSVGEVGNDDTPTLEISALELDTTSADLDYSQRLTIRATTFPSGETLLWSSSDETVATLSAESGRSVEVVAVNEGASTITCTAGGASQTCVVTVNAPKTLQITGVDYPATYSINGRGWKIRNGTVASTVDLASLTSVIKNASGVEVASAYTHTFNESTRRFDIREIDSNVPFSRITAAGAYTWTLTATDVGGRTVSVDMPINAVNDGDTAIFNEPGAQSQDIVDPGIAQGNTLYAGRNLIINSSFSGMSDAGIYHFSGDEVTFSSTEFNAKEYCFSLPLSEFGIQNISGKTLLISMEYRIDETLEFGITSPWVGCELGVIRDETTGVSQWLDWYGGKQIPTMITGGWIPFSCLVRVSSEDVLDSYIVFFFRDTKGTISFRHPKIEIIDTSWTPAPEDVSSTN